MPFSRKRTFLETAKIPVTVFKMKSIFSFLVLGVLVSTVGAAEPEMFPFTVSYEKPQANPDQSSNIADLSGWLDAPAGKHGFVRVENGHFATDAGPLRFWGTNTCFSANFVTHEQADRLAERLARFGINCVRLHHMDMHDIFGTWTPKSLLHLDPERLEKLDYLIAALKKRGIYVNINLHVSRWLDERDGFPPTVGRTTFDKGVDNFDPKLIALQKKYARDLLTHVNPYTQTAYTDEPAVAMIEVNNENSLLSVIGWGQWARIREPFASEFQRQWVAYLQQKKRPDLDRKEPLPSEKSVDHTAADKTTAPVELGPELVRDGSFSVLSPDDHEFHAQWNLEKDAQADADLAVAEDSDEAQNRILRLTIRKLGAVPWEPQLLLRNLAVTEGTMYKISFRIRSDHPCAIGFNLMQNAPPWSNLGLESSLELESDWKTVSLCCVAKKDEEMARISFGRFSPGTFELDDFSVRPVLVPGVKRATYRDFIAFLFETERAYFSEMLRFLKEDLKVRQPVSGTQLAYGSSHTQGEYDYCDDHSYWNHPHFPGKQWDMNNWYVKDLALVDALDREILPELAGRRILGKPYTLSEYNHPFPNRYAAEGFPLLAAFGSFQGWDGIFPFAYSHSSNLEPEIVTSFFDTNSNTVQLVHFPACAALFCRGDVREAEKTVVASLGKNQEIDLLANRLDPRLFGFKGLGLDPRIALNHKTAVDLSGKHGTPNVPEVECDSKPAVDGREIKTYTSDTGELRFVVDSEKFRSSFVSVDSPNTKFFSGFSQEPLHWNGVELKLLSDWATISLVSQGGNGFKPGAKSDTSQPVRILIAATGQIQNTNCEREDLGDRKTTLKKWGEPPILCEGIRAEIAIPTGETTRVRFFALDESGNRRAEIEPERQPGETRLRLDPKHKTLWYELFVE